MIISLFMASISPVFGVQGVVPYPKVLKDALNVAAIHSNWMVAQGAGDSMAPYYDNNTLLLIDKTPFTELQPGMIAVYSDEEGQIVGHSLTQQTNEGWTAQGYNNSSADPALVTQDNLIGIIFGTLKFAGSPEPSNLQIVHGKTYH